MFLFRPSLLREDSKDSRCVELALECSCACVHVCVCVRVRVGVTLEARKCCPIFILVKTALNVHQTLYIHLEYFAIHM